MNAKKALEKVVPGIGGFNSNFSGIGGELEYRNGSMVYDAELIVLSQGPVNSGDQFADPFSGDLMFKTGYALVNFPNVVLYPHIGAGAGYTLVNTYIKSGDVKQGLHSIYLIQPVLDLGLSANVIVYRFSEAMPTGILPVGIRTGYRFSGSSDNWRRVDGSSTFKADYSMRGWYVSIALGMGFLTSNQHQHK